MEAQQESKGNDIGVSVLFTTFIMLGVPPQNPLVPSASHIFMVFCQLNSAHSYASFVR